jgi:hypothetical protein
LWSNGENPASYNRRMRSPSLLSWRLAACLALPATATALAADAPSRGGEPVVQRIVQEDANVRVEELRVRGETQRVVVRPKAASAPAYEIVTGATGRDPGGAGEGRRGAVGQRVWNVFGF